MTSVSQMTETSPTGAPLGITELVLRDAHQSLLATRLRIDDMLPIADKLDRVGYWSLESWGGATFDVCIRYLGEDPWERIREFKKAMPNTPQQMLLRGQNLLGYRHYADDVVAKFAERAVKNGVDVFRIFDALNDPRNLETAIRAVVAQGAHAQGTLAYTVSPLHTLDVWLDLAKRQEDMGIHSLAIKDMAGLLTPYMASELVGRLKREISVPIHMQCHATTGLSTASIVKAVEAGIDNVDTAISSMSMTYGHSATESVVAIMAESGRDTGLDLGLLGEIADYFRVVRKKYARFEGELKGVDSRILVAQVPGGMLTNMENQLREQGASNRLDEVLKEIPRVREELGFIPLVTPTSQIVGTQATLNVLTGERYKQMTQETRGVLRGEYGATPAPVDAVLRERALEGDEPVSCRPADLIEPEFESLSAELEALSAEHHFQLADAREDDVLSYAMFPQIGLKFLQNRGDPMAFEPPPDAEIAADKPTAAPAAKVQASASVADIHPAVYKVRVDGQLYAVEVLAGEEGETLSVSTVPPSAAPQTENSASETLVAPLAGNVFKILVAPGARFAEGDELIILEAMKMETAVCAEHSGTVLEVLVAEGSKVELGAALLKLS